MLLLYSSSYFTNIVALDSSSGGEKNQLKNRILALQRGGARDRVLPGRRFQSPQRVSHMVDNK